MSKPEHDDDLLAAYLDGIAELDGDERRRVDDLLRDHPDARADADATRAMLDRLRALPLEGREPDWNVLEREIRAEVGPGMPPRPWWRRRATWLVPIGVLAAAAAIAMVWLHHPAETIVTSIATRDAGVTAPEPVATAATALWLDGEAFEIGDVDPAVLDNSHDALAAGPGAEPADDLGILPADDLGWVDNLDDKAIDRAEHWLARKKG